jgi:protein kinase C substrate 80K-H
MYVTLMQKYQRLQQLEQLSSSPSSFGAKREYFPLLGRCFTNQSNEKHFKGGSFENIAKDFLFEVCPFGRITQVGTETAASPTLLGVFQGWDDAHENIMIYNGGDECWNGPDRLVHLQMECGLDDKLADVRENGKCTYEFVFESPAACNKKHADKLKKYLKQISPAQENKGSTHDEL